MVRQYIRPWLSCVEMFTQDMAGQHIKRFVSLRIQKYCHPCIYERCISVPPPPQKNKVLIFKMSQCPHVRLVMFIYLARPYFIAVFKFASQIQQFPTFFFNHECQQICASQCGHLYSMRQPKHTTQVMYSL